MDPPKNTRRKWTKLSSRECLFFDEIDAVGDSAAFICVAKRKADFEGTDPGKQIDLELVVRIFRETVEAMV